MIQNGTHRANFDEAQTPRDDEAELALVAAILANPEIMLEDGLPLAKHFFRDDAAIVYAAYQELLARGLPIDAQAVRNHLVAAGKWEQIRGASFLAEAAETLGNAGLWRHYADRVIARATLRGMFYAGQQITARAIGVREIEHVQDLLDVAEKEVLSIGDDQGAAKCTLLGPSVEAAFSTVKSTLNGKAPAAGLATGFDEFDQRTGGLHDGALGIIAARTSVGKSAFIGQMAVNMAGQGQTVLLVTLEMSRAEVSARALSAVSGVDSHRTRTARNLTPGELEDLRKATDRLKAMPLYVVDQPNVGVRDIGRMARQLKRKAGLRMIAIDYLQLMKVETRGIPRHEQVSELSRSLKQLARDLNLPIIAAAQLNRNVETASDRRPRLSHLRESGAIEQDADVVILLHRPEMFEPEREDLRGNAELIIAKNRSGPVSSVHLFWHAATQTFLPIDPADRHREWKQRGLDDYPDSQ